MDTLKQIVEYDNYDIELEKRLFEEFLKSRSLKVDPGFTRSFKTGDIIEIYSYPDHTQIFANREFLRLCSYSPEQMQAVPFQKLFWRESEVQQALLKRAVTIVEEGVTQNWNLPPHDLVEALHPRRRTFEMHMGVLTPVFDETNKVVGWASTLKVEYIFELTSAEDLS